MKATAFFTVLLIAFPLMSQAQMPSTCAGESLEGRVQFTCVVEGDEQKPDQEIGYAFSKATFNNTLEAGAFCRSHDMDLDGGMFFMLMYFGLLSAPGDAGEEVQALYNHNVSVSREILGNGEKVLGWKPLPSSSPLASANTLEEAEEFLRNYAEEKARSVEEKQEFLDHMEKYGIASFFAIAWYDTGSFSQRTVDLGKKLIDGKIEALPELHAICISKNIQDVLN